MTSQLNPGQRRFVDEYLVDLNATQAAIRAGYSPKTAGAQAFELLKKPEIQEAVTAAMDKRAKRTGITQDKVLKRLWQLVNADPSDIVQLRRLNCRHCYGWEYGYQWVDQAEYDRAVASALAKVKKDEKPVLPSADGGFGFEALGDPNPSCPYCNGEGLPDIHINDTRHLDAGAKMLFNGLKQTQNGIEIKFADRLKPLEMVARHLGMFNDKLAVTGANGGPLETHHTVEFVTPDETATPGKD